MPAPSSADTKYLEVHGTKWRVVINVPRRLQGKLGTKLKRALGTDSLSEANRLKWDVVAEFKALIQKAQNPAMSKDAAIALARVKAMEEARRLSRQRLFALTTEERQRIDDRIEDRAEHLAGEPTGVGDMGIAEYEPERDALAMQFMAIAKNTETPIDFHHDKYMSMTSVKARTAADDNRAIKHLKAWCEAKGLPATLQSITKRAAVRFCDDLHELVGTRDPATLNKYVSRLSVYWAWLEGRHEVEFNVWRGRRFKKPMQTTDQKERPFTDKEMVALLAGPASQAMHDAMRVAALSGARLDAIVCLRVKDIQNNNFVFKPQKKEPGPRLCPIHPDLVEIISRRSEGKQEDDDIFPEWPGPKKEGSLRERSFKTSNQFTEYRRRVGVDDQKEGKRRSSINFHSFRRWFATKAEQADQPEHIIATVIGHKRNGITLGVYSGGPLLEQARRCVEAVKLPDLTSPG
ncbi:tyrosine-type recombinase/integrase [Ensifer aridi]|uniref:tyrosine-type recombinase/integrase n=1 Tax=Ensifer aridi TaxID=1708715 RepID=UPI000A1059D7|nr:tyrosine-type recombinase/integrase [Ensifer aridi]